MADSRTLVVFVCGGLLGNMILEAGLIKVSLEAIKPINETDPNKKKIIISQSFCTPAYA